MGHDHPFGPGRADRALQPGPVRVVAEDEPAIDRAPPAGAAKLHPAAREGVAVVAEATGPGRVLGRRRRDDQRAAEFGLVPCLAHQPRRRQGDARLAIGSVQRLDGAVHEDRPDRRVDAGDHPLRLAEAVAEQQARTAGGGIARPPAVDLGEERPLRRPAVDRQPERALGDEAVAAHRLEGLARRVGVFGALARAREPVVSRSDPDTAAVLEAHLRRTEHVAGGVQRHLHAEMIDGLAIGQRLQRNLAEPRPQHAFGPRRGQVAGVASAGMVGVRMRDDGTVDRPPRIDVEIAGSAIEAFRPGDDEVVVPGHPANVNDAAAPRPAQR